MKRDERTLSCGPRARSQFKQAGSCKVLQRKRATAGAPPLLFCNQKKKPFDLHAHITKEANVSETSFEKAHGTDGLKKKNHHRVGLQSSKVG